MNGIDLLAVLLVGFNAYWGARRGFYLGLLDLAAIVVALGVASIGYSVGAWLLGHLLGLRGAAGGLGGFVLVALTVAKLVSLGQRFLPAREGKPPAWERIGGGLIGTLLGVLMAALLLSALAGLPLGEPIRTSFLGRPFAQGVPHLYQTLEAWGMDLPKLVQLPRDYEDELAPVFKTQLQFRRLNFTRLDGATCIKCRGRVKFLGYLRKDEGPLTPKFQCTRCGRTSDGCQTFEGFHRMYGKCPTKVANDGYQLDCGMWSNGEWVIPRGRCPVCGEAAKEWLEKPW
ncbi:MAG TPA: CvpA family protein [Armatimonadetes bacterium]|nr:CvpA family protein [Armatimonadota bacterium]